MTSRLIAHSAAQKPIPLDPLQEAANLAFDANIAQAWQAGGVMLFVLALIICVWVTFSRMSPPRQLFSTEKRVNLARSIALSTFLAVASVSWDTWWHRAVGRDTLWEAPHVLLYTFSTYCILASLYGWYGTRDKQWKILALVLLVVPMGAPFDQLWHTFFGIEDLRRPVALIWAPPHLLIAFASAFTWISILPILSKDTSKDVRQLMGILGFGTLTATAFFLLLPVHPTQAYGQLLGFWGALPMATSLVTVPLIGRSWLKDRVGATKLMMVTALLLLTALTTTIAPEVILNPHDVMENWILIWMILLVGALLDSTDCLPFWLRGLCAGLLGAAFMFGLQRHFCNPLFTYGFDKVIVAITAGGIGGLIGGMIAGKTISHQEECRNTQTGTSQCL